MSAVVDAVFGSYDVKNAKQWRDEDLLHREQQKQWREDAIRRETEWRRADLERERRVTKLESEKRLIDARHQQLQTVSQLSAMLAFFSIMFIQEIKALKSDTSQPLLVIYGTVGALEFLCMLLCSLTCTLLLLALTRFVTHTLDGEVRRLSDAELDTASPFTDWWLGKCEHEWLLAYQLFQSGASFFLVAIGLAGWIVFVRSTATSVVVSALCVGGLLYYNLRIASRWRYLVKPSSSRRMSVPLP
ncbi:Homoserine dehydrogenase [Phytophthora pseudosyringae]|uniref:Homoserine dehydrogenase n=1 Tax=Phytophthora pseudosyringae TaxID=221518 RepID=A0A8T1VIF4_9STRA|nr:Homoserine dehydrogenase [Phytophthora pseudosyringae]